MTIDDTLRDVTAKVGPAKALDFHIRFLALYEPKHGLASLQADPFPFIALQEARYDRYMTMRTYKEIESVEKL